MPIYEYKCPVCNYRFSVLQRLGEGNEHLRCEKCGEPKPIKHNFRPSHLPVVVNVIQPQAVLLQVVLREREQVVKQSKTGCFTRIFII